MKKAISIFTALTTILWLSGVAMLPIAHAVTFEDGDIVREADEFDVYIIKLVGDKKFKRLILNPDVFNMYGHLEWENIQVVADGTLADYTTSELVRADGDEKVYKLFPDGDVGTKKWVDSLDCFTSQGYDWDSVYIINTFDRDSYTTAATTMCEEGVVAGGLSVALAADTPASATVPKSGTSVDFLKINFTAGSEGAVSITNLVLHRGGLGSTNDFDNLYLYEGTSRLTDGRSVSAATNNVTFSGLGISIPAGTTKAITLVADMGTTTTTPTNYFELVSDDSITSDASSITGTFPIKGNTMTLSNAATVGTVTIAALSDPANPKIGAKGATIARFSLAAANEDMTLNELRLVVKGTIDDEDLTNLVLKRGTEELATDAALSAKGYMEFVLATPYAFEDGDTKNFEVVADVAGESGDTVKIYLDEDMDLVAIGSDYGYGCAVTRTTYDGTTADTDSSDVTLEAGQITIAFNGPATSDVGLDTSDTVLLDFSITAQMFVTVKEMDVQFTGNDLKDTVYTIQDLKIKNKDTGVTIQGPKELSAADSTTDDNDMTISFTEDYDIQAGETLNLQITGDIQSSTYVATGTDWFKATIDISGLEIEDANRDTVTDIVPSGDIAGNTMSVVAASLTVALASSPATSEPTEHTYVTGYSGAEAVGFSFTTVEASSIEVTDLTLTAFIAEELASDSDMDAGLDAAATVYVKDVVSAVSIYDGSVDPANLIAGPETVTTAGLVEFDNFSWTIPADTTKILIVGVDISTTAPYDGDSDFVAFDIDDVSADITCYDKDGDVVAVANTDRTNNALSSSTNADPYVFIEASSAGTLTTALSGVPQAALVIAGDTDVPFNRIKFTSTDEAFLVDKITVVIDDVNDNTNVKRVKIKYLNESGNSVTESTALVGADAVFTGCTFWVPKNGSAYLEILADLNDVFSGATSTDAFQLEFKAQLAGDFHAVGQDSGELIVGTDDNIDDADAAVVTSKTMTVYRSIPAFEHVAISGYTGNLIPTTQKVAIFSITANGDDVIFNKTSGSLTFDIIASGQAGNTALTLYDWNDDVVASIAAFDLSSGATDKEFAFDEDQGGIIIPKGETKELYIKANLQYFSDDGDYFQMQLNDNTAADIEWMDDDRAAYDAVRQSPTNQMPGLDIDFETFLRNI